MYRWQGAVGGRAHHLMVAQRETARAPPPVGIPPPRWLRLFDREAALRKLITEVLWDVLERGEAAAALEPQTNSSLQLLHELDAVDGPGRHLVFVDQGEVQGPPGGELRAHEVEGGLAVLDLHDLEAELSGVGLDEGAGRILSHIA